jgi:meiotic recombination protein SPO11
VKPGTRFILVIEKEGIYHRLCEEGFHMRVPCIMVTGCGFPDIATRALVSRLSDLHPELKLVGLCDHNPYGLALLLSYRFSSVATAFEGLGLQAHALRWLGLRYDHVKALLEDQDDPLDESSIQSLSLSDKRKIRAMLRTNTIQSMPEYVRELELMLSADRKCELEVLYSMGINFLGDFLERAMHSEDYI